MTKFREQINKIEEKKRNKKKEIKNKTKRFYEMLSKGEDLKDTPKNKINLFRKSDFTNYKSFKIAFSDYKKVYCKLEV